MFSMHSLIEIMGCHDSLITFPAYYSIFIEQIERKLRYYEWSFVQSEQKIEVANLIKYTLKIFPT